jgi:hypothetical protein
MLHATGPENHECIPASFSVAQYLFKKCIPKHAELRFLHTPHFGLDPSDLRLTKQLDNHHWVISKGKEASSMLLVMSALFIHEYDY